VLKAGRPAGGNLAAGADTPFFVEQTHQMSMIVSDVIVTNEEEPDDQMAPLLATIAVRASASAIGFLAGEFLRQA
jgi:hypothetical protein